MPPGTVRSKLSPRRYVGGLHTLALALALTYAPAPAALEHLKVRVHRTLPHDTEAFTQGLLWWNGKLYESVGQRGKSELRRLNPETGAVEKRAAIPVFFFAEGLALAGERLVMLTWQAERAFVFQRDSFAKLGTLPYSGEGWGLCHDGGRFVMSDGSSELTFRHSTTFGVVGEVVAMLEDAPLAGLNELECVGDAVYANVWQHDFIVRIDLASGRVTQRIDAAGLLDAAAARQADVLNGIAYAPQSDRFYITGKRWPTLFEVTFEAAFDVE